MVRQEQNRILTSFYDLENKYKEILKENVLIKNEINDMKKRQSDISFQRRQTEHYRDMPLNKTLDGNKDTAASLTPSKRDFSVTDNQSKHNEYSYIPGSSSNMRSSFEQSQYNRGKYDFRLREKESARDGQKLPQFGGLR